MQFLFVLVHIVMERKLYLNLELVRTDTVLPTPSHRCSISLKEIKQRYLDIIGQELAPQTNYTLNSTKIRDSIFLIWLWCCACLQTIEDIIDRLLPTQINSFLLYLVMSSSKVSPWICCHLGACCDALT